LGCSLREAQQLAIERRKFIVYYIEEHMPAFEVTPSLETALFRNALSQNGIVVGDGTNNELDCDVLHQYNITKLLNDKVGWLELFSFILSAHFLTLTALLVGWFLYCYLHWMDGWMDGCVVSVYDE
jgi:hypothetical protein